MPKCGIPLHPNGANFIRDYLTEKDISQEAFARSLDVCPRTLNNWLAGRTAIELEKLQWIIWQVGIGLDDFFGGQVPKEFRGPDGVVSCVWQFYKFGIAATIEKAYTKVVKFFKEQISFVKFPKTGFFQTFEHEVQKGKNYYFQFWIIPTEEIVEAKFIMSFTIANPTNSQLAIRISYGEVTVKPMAVEINQYFQPSNYQVKRPDKHLCAAKVVTWFDELPHTFVVNGNVKFRIEEKGPISEEELRRSSDIAVFWKHFFFHGED